MCSKLGRHQRLEELLASTSTRVIGGSAAEMVEQAKQGLWQMRNHPDKSLVCGPAGLDRILAFKNADYHGDSTIRNFRATANGTTLAQMRSLRSKPS